MTACTRPAQDQAIQNSNMSKGGRETHEVPVLFEEILAVDCWGKKRPFSSGMLAHGPVGGTIPIYIQEALNELFF